MGYQESVIYTSLNNVEKNNKDIEQIIYLFQKYGCRCEGDTFATCAYKLSFTRDACKFKKGMKALVICGEKDVQRNSMMLFNTSLFPDSNDIDKNDAHFIKRIKITPIEEVMYILTMEDTREIIREKLTLIPSNTKANTIESNLGEEIYRDDIDI